METHFTCETKNFIQLLQVFLIFFFNGNFVSHFYLLKKPTAILMIHTEAYHLITTGYVNPYSRPAKNGSLPIILP